MAAPVGAYGKMPSVGDFFRLNAPVGFVTPWDGWLQDGLATARAAQGGAWQVAYLGAPIWRFTLAAGLAGAGPMIGVLMASIDRVGRQFPLTLVAPGGPELGSDLLAPHLAPAGFEALEDLALRVLEEDLPREALAAALAALDLPTGGTAAAGPWQFARPLTRLAEAAEAAARPGMSVWSALGPAAVRLMVVPGLPQGAAFAALFDETADMWREAGPA